MAKDQKIEIRCELSDKNVIKANANNAGMDVSDFILSRCLPSELVEPPMPEKPESFDIGGLVPTKKSVQHLDMGYLNGHRIRMEVYFKRLKAEGIVFDWSLCVKPGTEGHKSRCKQLHVPLCDACIGQNADMIKRKADLDAKIEAGRKAEMEAINAYRS